MFTASAASTHIAGAGRRADGRTALLQRDFNPQKEKKQRNMSVTVRRSISAKAESRKCAARFWKIFPHLLLWSSLVGFAALGALMFQHIEGGNKSTDKKEYFEFLDRIVSTVQNLTGKWAQICCGTT